MNYDIIVIGGGHNGLTAAALLGQQGKRVLVLEKNPFLGGLAGSSEFHPGFYSNGILHDTSGLRPSIIDKLGLKKHGLETAGSRPMVTFLSNDGQSITLSSDLDASKSSIAKYSAKDAEAYGEYLDFIRSIGPFLANLLDNPQPNLSDLNFQDYWKLLSKGWQLKKLGKKVMLELLKVAPMCVADFLNERFETDLLKAGMAQPALLGTFTGPWSSYSTLNLLLWESTAKENVIGGPLNLTKALANAAASTGVDIRTEAEVEKILLENNEVKGVLLNQGEKIDSSIVLASCSPVETFFNLLTSRELGPDLELQVSHLRHRGVTAKVNIALKGKMTWKTDVPENTDFIRICKSINETEKAFDAVKYDQISEIPILDVYLPKAYEPESTGEATSIISILAQYVPYRLNGGWSDEAKQLLGVKILDILSDHVEDIKSNLIGIEILAPPDIEEKFNLAGGHIYHLEPAIDQMIGRPIPSCAQYRTPFKGLYVGGSGSHPGGGITCVPGMLAAQSMLNQR